MKNIRSFVLLCCLLALGLTAGHAVPPTPSQTMVHVHPLPFGPVTQIDVSGSVTFGGDALHVVGEDPDNDAIDPDLQPAAAALGLEATEIAIHQPDPKKPAVEFVIRVTDLAAPAPQEIVRYLWQFKVNGKEYWISAKSSDLTTATGVVEDPAGSATHLNGAFRLRGECATLVAVSNCKHLMWVDGAFDLDADEVRVTVPLGDTRAPDFVPGATIDPDDGMTASIQAVVSNGTTSDTVAQTDSYAIPVGTVKVGIGVPGQDPASVDYVYDATVSDGSFTSSIDVSALPPGTYEAFAKGCFGSTCGYGSWRFYR